jgi:hypothetical protein
MTTHSISPGSTIGRIALTSVFAAAAFVAAPARTEAAPVTLSFTCTGTNGTDPSCFEFDDAYTLEIDSAGGDDIYFKIYNNGKSGYDTGAISNVYFDVPSPNPFTDGDGGYGISDSGSGVNFQHDTSPDDPFSGWSSAYEAVSTSDSNGVDAGQWVRFQFDLGSSFTLQNILTALSNGSLRVAIAAVGLDRGDDEFAYFKNNPYSAPTNPTPVPEPASLILVGSGLAGIVRMAQKRRAQRAAQQS